MTVHNRRETTLSCLKHLSDLVYDRDAVHVDYYLTNDGCTDGTADAVHALFPEVRIVTGDGNLFWNRGMHLAWTKAEKLDYDFYWWINDDTFVEKDALTRMLEVSASHKDEVLTVGSTIASDGDGTVTYGGLKDGRLIEDLGSERKCDTMNGNIVLIPRSVFKRIGKNDPYYHHALGDYDYGLRAGKSGIGIYLVPGICGFCDLHEKPVIWMDPSYPLRKRWKNFFSPAGNNPFEFFHFRKRHFGVFAACTSFITNFIHLFFPSLWTRNKKKNI